MLLAVPLLLPLVLTVPAAADAPVHAELVTLGPLVVEGTLRASAQDAVLRVLPLEHGGGAGPSTGGTATGEASAPVLVLHVPRGTLHVFRVTRDVADNPLGGDIALPPEEHTEVVPLDGAELRVQVTDPAFLALLIGVGGAPLMVDLGAGVHRWSVDAEGSTFTAGSGAGRPPDHAHTTQVRPGSLRLTATPLPSEAVGVVAPSHVEMVLDHAALEVRGPDGRRAFQLGLAEHTRADAAGQRVLYQRTSAYAVLVLEAPEVRLGVGVPLRLHAPSADLEVQGRVVVPDARGHVDLGSAGGGAEARTVVLDGAFRMALAGGARDAHALSATQAGSQGRAAGGAGMSTTLDGSVTAARVGGRTLLGPLDVASQAAAPLAALTAVVVAWFAGAGQKVLGLALLVTGGTPSSREEALRHPRRQEVYEVVLKEPGIHMRALQRATGIRWSLLQYHVAVLGESGALQRIRVGRRTVLAADVHGLLDSQLHALHVLRGERARRMATVIAQHDGLTLPQLARAVSLSPRTVSRYLQMMRELDLVEPVDPSRRVKRYTATARMAHLMPHAAAAPEPTLPFRSASDALP